MQIPASNLFFIIFSAIETTNWQDELKNYWLKIEDDTKSSLRLIKQDRIRRGLPFDDNFIENFERSANTQ